MKKPAVPRLHVITDEVLQSQYTHPELTRIVVEAGADGVQFREKRPKDLATLVATVADMRTICSEKSATLIVNDFVDVAISAGINAIHLGRTDEPIADARRRVGKEVLIGGTANSLAEAKRVSMEDVDYLGVGPVFGTSSKTSPAPRLGLSGLEEICHSVDVPVIAIGNIQSENVKECLRVGAYGVAVISAIVCSNDVASATKRFMDEIHKIS